MSSTSKNKDEAYKKSDNTFTYSPGDSISRTETPVRFTDGHDIPKGPFDGHGNPMAPIPGQRWSITDHGKISEKKFVQDENWQVHVVNIWNKTANTGIILAQIQIFWSTFANG